RGEGSYSSAGLARAMRPGPPTAPQRPGADRPPASRQKCPKGFKQAGGSTEAHPPGKPLPLRLPTPIPPPLPSGRFPQQPLQKKTPARPHPWDARLGLRGASSLFPFVFPASHKAARHPPDHLSESRPLHKKGPPTAGPAADAPRTGLPFKQIGEETPKNGAPHPSTAPR